MIFESYKTTGSNASMIEIKKQPEKQSYEIKYIDCLYVGLNASVNQNQE